MTEREKFIIAEQKQFYDRAGSLDAGERIIPVSEADAYKWAVAHLDPDDIYRAFPGR